MYKKLSILHLVLVTIAIAILPIANFAISPSSFKFKNSYSTDSITGLYNYTLYKYFQKSGSKKEVVVGKDGYLFIGNKHNRVISKTSSKYLINQHEINAWAKKVAELKDWYAAQGVDFLLVLAPNKHTIYSEFLPEGVQLVRPNISDFLVKSLKEQKVPLIDLRDDLLELKKNDQIYWKTDTHWNQIAASYAYNLTLDTFNSIYKLGIKKSDFKLHAKERAAGDLVNIIKMTEFMQDVKEIEYSYELAASNICTGKINLATLATKACDQPQQELHINFIPWFSSNTISENDLSLLYIRDSFGVANSELYNHTFSKTWQFHWSKLNGKALKAFVEQNKPDIVLYQIGERIFYNQDIIEDFD